MPDGAVEADLLRARSRRAWNEVAVQADLLRARDRWSSGAAEAWGQKIATSLITATKTKTRRSPKQRK